MKKQKIWLLLCGLLAVSAGVSGCKMVREIDTGDVNITTPTPTEEVKQSENPDVTESPSQTPIVTMEPTENPVTIVVENGPVLNEKEILSYFYGQDKETLIEEGYLEEHWYGEHKLGYACDKSGVLLQYTYAYNLDAGDSLNFISVRDMRNGGAAAAYEEVCELGYIGEYKFLENFPEIDLESCSRAEAIAACTPLARICGYEDAQVKAYAVTEEYLKEFTEYWVNTNGHHHSAPKPDYEYVSQCDIDAARESGNEQLAQELESKLEFDDCEIVEWTKEHEAYIIVYRSMLNGLVLDDKEYNMYCIYVPLYDSIVYVNATQPLIATEGKEETNLMTQDEAIAKMLLYLGIENLEDITITGISMVYDAEYEKVNQNQEEWTIDPCWRIDYILSDRLAEMPMYKKDKYDKAVTIDAVDGSTL